MAAKKKATRKAAKKAAKKAVAKVAADAAETGLSTFDTSFLENRAELATRTGSILKALEEAQEAKKYTPLSFRRLSDLQTEFLPFRDFYMQLALRLRGLVRNTITEVLGSESVGKTSLIWWLLGGYAELGYPCLYIGTENKPLLSSRIHRLVSGDPRKSAAIMHEIYEAEAFEMKELVLVMEEWASAVRKDGGVPLTKPLVIAVDTWSKLMPKNEAVGYYDWDKNMDAAVKRKQKDVGEAANMTSAKFAHAFCRLMPMWLRKYNANLIVASHRNQHVDTSSFKPMGPLPDLYNKTRRSGTAFDQNAALLLNLKSKGQWKEGDNLVGKIISGRVAKHSHGPEGLLLEYRIRSDGFADTPARMAPALDFSESLANYFVDHRLYSASVLRKRYSSAPLGLERVTAAEFAERVCSDENVMADIGRKLGIAGYDDTVDRILEDYKKGLEDAQS